MVFIRRVRTASGATAVQIAQYVDGRQRIVQHVGSAHSEADLGVLLARARELLEPAGQQALDLGVEPAEPTGPARVLVAAPSPDQPLFGGQAVAAGAGGSGQAPSAGAARVVSTDARVLFTSLAGVYSSLGFDGARGVADEVFRDLVIARVVEPTSLLTRLGS